MYGNKREEKGRISTIDNSLQNIFNQYDRSHNLTVKFNIKPNHGMKMDAKQLLFLSKAYLQSTFFTLFILLLYFVLRHLSQQLGCNYKKLLC